MSVVTRITLFWHSPRLRKTLAALLVLAGLAAATVWLLPLYLKQLALQQAEQVLGRRLTLERLDFSPWRLSLSAHGLCLFEADGVTPAVSARALHLRLSLASVAQRALVLDEVRLEAPSLHWLRTAQHSNFDDMLARLAARPHSAGTMPFALANLQIRDGSLFFEDQVARQNHHVTALQLRLPAFSNLPSQREAWLEPVLSAQVNGAALSLNGRVKPFAANLESTLALALEQADLRPYLAYVPAVPLRLQQGVLSARMTFAFQRTATAPQWRLAGDVRLNRLELTDKDGAPLLQADQLTLEKLTADSTRRSVAAAALRVQGLAAALRRDARGRWLAPGAAPTDSAAPDKRAPWRFELTQLDVRDASLDWLDQSVSPPVHVSATQMALAAASLNSDFSQAANLKLSAQINRQGRLALSGRVSAHELALDIDGQALPFASLTPYFAQRLNVAITRGQADLHGQLAVQNAGAAALQGSYQGSLALNDFHILEKGASEDFLEWKTIRLDGIRAQMGNPAPSFEVAQLGLNDFYARAVLSEQGRLNLQNILVKNTVNPAPTERAAGPVRLRIAKTTLRGGKIDFSDHYIKPNYSARLTGLSGAIGALASDTAAAAALELKGEIDDEAPLLISGRINPLREPLYLDIQGSANGLELTRLSPYAVKYAGYPIVKGKLSAQVAYRVENRELKAENALRLDQLTFGERVESPRATQLPVLLALALLKDHNGQIAVNLPISGSLSDPQFSVGDIVLRVFGNFLWKSVTSPFSALAAMFGHSEELSYVAFPGGQAVLTPELRTRLEQLAQALRQRPGLQLDIGGLAGVGADGAGVQQAALLAQLRTLKWQSLHQQGSALTQSEISLSAAERDAWLLHWYLSENQGAVALKQAPSARAAEAFLLQRLPVTDEDLLRLAQQRADAVRDYLEDQCHIERERLFLTAPGVSSAPGTDAARVVFVLK